MQNIKKLKQYFVIRTFNNNNYNNKLPVIKSDYNEKTDKRGHTISQYSIFSYDLEETCIILYLYYIRCQLKPYF